MATDGTGPTPPEPARPLTERERDTFAELEAAIHRQDPEWSALLAQQAQQASPQHRVSARRRNLVIQVLVVVVLAVVLLPGAWLGGLLVVIVQLGPVGVAWWGMRRGVL